MTLPTTIALTDENLEYIAGVAFMLLDHHHKLVLWREAYLQTTAMDSDASAEDAAANADSAVADMNAYIESLDEVDEEAAEVDEPVVVPGRS